MENIKKVSVAIAGFGIVGERRYKCINKIKGMKVVSVCDRNKNVKSKFSADINFYTDYKKMLIRENIDALFVCMSNDILPEVVCSALELGMHVFCEKPPGKDLESIKKIVNVKKSLPNLKLMYGFNHRYHDSINNANKIIKSKQMGKIINMRGIYGKAKMITFNQNNWRTKRKLSGGGVLLDQGIHMVDLMRYFAGEFTEVFSIVSNDHYNYDVEDNAYALMKTSDGVVATLHSSATQWHHRFSLEINLEKGSVNLNGILSGTKSYGEETMAVISADPDNDFGRPVEKRYTYNYDPSWEKEVEQFYTAIKQNQSVSDVGIEDAYETMKLVYEIYYADHKWRKTYNIKKPLGIYE